MKKLLIATHNQAKYDYFSKLFRDFDLQTTSLSDLKIKDEAPEQCNNETENAVSKAVYYMKKSGLVSLSDDAGMYIPALNNEPGVQVRRWAGKFSDDISDKDWLEYFMSRMQNIEEENRIGQFKIARAVASPDGKLYTQKWERNFKIAKEPNWENYESGWPMSTLCIEKDFDKPWTKMSWEERIYYERKNLEEFKNIFNKIYE